MTGFKPHSQMEAALKAPYIADGTHPVPVSNFLNAQCTSRKPPVFRSIASQALTYL